MKKINSLKSLIIVLICFFTNIVYGQISFSSGTNPGCPGTSLRLVFLTDGRINSNIAWKINGLIAATQSGGGLTYSFKDGGTKETITAFNAIGQKLQTLIVESISEPYSASTIIGNANVCKGQSVITYTVPSIPNATSYSWKLPTGATGSSKTNSIKVTYGTDAQSGNIIVSGQNQCPNGGIVSLFPVTVNTLPVITASASKTAICLGDNVSLTGSGATSYVWEDNVSNGVAFSPTATKMYTVTGTDANGCYNTTTVSVNVNNLPSVKANSSKNSVCLGDYVVLSGSGAINYTWDNNVINEFDFIPTETKNYTVTGTDINGCRNTSTINVNVNILPSVKASASKTTVCSGDNVTLSGLGASIYSWNNDITNGVSFVPTNTKVYTLTGTDNNGCKDTANITVNVINLSTTKIEYTQPAALCTGTTKLLNAPFFDGATYQWKKNGVAISGATNSTFSVNSAGAYSLSTSLGSACKSDAPSVNILVETAPIVTISGPSKICWNGRAMFRASLAGGVWAPIDNTLLLASPQGLFRNGVKPATDNYKSGVSYTVSSKLGACTTKATKNVYVRNVIAPSVTISTLKSSIKVNESTTVTATTAISSTGTWSSTNTLVSALANPLNTKTATVKGLRVGSGANVVYFADDATTGCRNAGYLAYSVTAAASMVSVSTNSETSTSNTSLYPNPSNGKFTLNSTEDVNSVELIDISGRVIAVRPITASTTTIDFTGVSSGKYMLQITGDQVNEMQPIVIE